MYFATIPYFDVMQVTCALTFLVRRADISRRQWAGHALSYDIFVRVCNPDYVRVCTGGLIRVYTRNEEFCLVCVFH